MTTVEETYENSLEEIPEGDTPGNYICRYCPEPYVNGTLRYNHERALHPTEFMRDSPDGRRRMATPRNTPKDERRPPVRPPINDESAMDKQQTIAGVNMGSVHELTRRFAESLQNTASEMSGAKKKQIILAFDDVSFQVNSNPALLDRFLNQCGVSRSQGEYIKLILLGMEEDKNPWNQTGFGNTPGAPQAMTIDRNTGQLVPAPIFMLGGNNSGGGGSAPAPMILMPPGGWGNDRRDEFTRRDVEDYVDRAVEKIQAAQPKAPEANPNVRRFQRPVANADGSLVMDANTGQPIMAWVEEPIDAFNDMISKLSSLGVIGAKPTPDPVSAEDIGKTVAVEVQKLMPPADDKRDSEIQGLRDDFKEYMHTNELKEATRSGAEEALDRYQQTINPYLEELKELRNHTGLSDRQYELKHEEDKNKTIIGALTNAMDGFRADLQPLAIQNMVASMKAMDLSENTINEALSRMPMPGGRGMSQAEGNLQAETMNKWVQD